MEEEESIKKIKAREKIAQMAAAQIRDRGLKEELERRVSFACAAIFAALNFALFLFAGCFGCGGADLKYFALACDTAIALMLVFGKDPLPFAKGYFGIAAGFYSYIFFCRGMEQAAVFNALYWIAAIPFTMRLKKSLSILFLMASEAFYVALIRAIIEKL
ncbi:MAG: hypothetical protein J6T16_03185 [Opitutales bacterium]|nr:hypothetical protein [Opitutales bacterium]